MEEDLVARLLANAGLAAIVAAGVNWIERPRASALPSVTLQVISPGRRYTHDGPIALSGPRVQADCWGRSYGEAKRVARAMIAAIEPAAVQGATRFAQAFLDGARDMPPEDLDGGVTVFRVSQDWIVWHRPA